MVYLAVEHTSQRTYGRSQRLAPEIGGPCSFVKTRQDVAKNDQYCTGDAKYGDHKAGTAMLQVISKLTSFVLKVVTGIQGPT